MHQPEGMQRQLLLVAVCTLFGGCTSVVHTRTISTGTLRDAARVLETERTASVVDSRGETFSLSRDDRLMLDDELLRLLPPSRRLLHRAHLHTLVEGGWEILDDANKSALDRK